MSVGCAGMSAEFHKLETEKGSLICMNKLGMGPHRTCVKHFFFKYKINSKTQIFFPHGRLISKYSS